MPCARVLHIYCEGKKGRSGLIEQLFLLNTRRDLQQLMAGAATRAHLGGATQYNAPDMGKWGSRVQRRNGSFLSAGHLCARVVHDTRHDAAGDFRHLCAL